MSVGRDVVEVPLGPLGALRALRVGELLVSSQILGSVSDNTYKALGPCTQTQGSRPSPSLLTSPFYFNRWVIDHLAGLLGTCWVWPAPCPRTAQASSRGLSQGSGPCSWSSSWCCSWALSCASRTEWWPRRAAPATGTAVFLMTDTFLRLKTLVRAQLTGSRQKSQSCKSLEDASDFPAGLPATCWYLHYCTWRQWILLHRKSVIPGGWQAIHSPNKNSLHGSSLGYSLDYSCQTWSDASEQAGPELMWS